MPHISNPLPTHRSERRDQLVTLIQSRNIITTPNTLPINQNIRHRPSPSILRQKILQFLTDRVLIQFDDKRLRRNSVSL